MPTKLLSEYYNYFESLFSAGGCWIKMMCKQSFGCDSRMLTLKKKSTYIYGVVILLIGDRPPQGAEPFLKPYCLTARKCCKNVTWILGWSVLWASMPANEHSSFVHLLLATSLFVLVTKSWEVTDPQWDLAFWIFSTTLCWKTIL